MRVHLSWPMTVIAAVAMTLVIAIGSGGGAGAQSIPTDPQGGCPVTPAKFASWFESGAPAANGVVKPADSTTFPDIPNCTFFDWSKQMFLWLTSPAPSRYGGGSRIFNSPVFFDVSPPDSNGQRTLSQHEPGFIKFFRVRMNKPGPHNLPVIVDKTHRLFEVQAAKIGPTGKPIVVNAQNREIEVSRIAVGANRKAQFFDATNKAVAGAKPKVLPTRPAVVSRPTVSARGTTIAAKSLPTAEIRLAQQFVIDKRPIFVDLLGNVIDTEEGQALTDAALMTQGHSLVYFATMVNDVYAYFLTGNKNNAFNPAFTTFPMVQADLTKIAAYAATKNVTFPDGVALAIEVKSAWVEASTLSNPGDYITMNATVPSYNTANAAQWVPNGTRNVTLALVSIHVVGSTKGHPEMIWATFEHFGSTPNATYKYNSTTGLKTVPQDAGGPWLFARTPPTAPFNCEHMKWDTTNNDIVAVQPPGNCSSPVPGTVSPSDTLRTNPFGIAGTNASFNTMLISSHNTTQVPGNDIRNKYFMTGATWTPFGIPPTASNGVGTNVLANSALETYTQNMNCFACHLGFNMLGDPGGGGLSHIYGPIKKLF
jgi:hypothetical protein